jgi:hypothetical protein
MLSRFTAKQKIGHLLKWATEWSEGGQGRSMWLYSLNLGGSHALLNDWIKNQKILNTLTQEEKDIIDAARKRSSESPRKMRPVKYFDYFEVDSRG